LIFKPDGSGSPRIYGARANSRAAFATKTKAGFQKNRICFVNLEIYCLLYADLKIMKKYIYTMSTITTTTLKLAGGSSDMV
jgi:hypothetical protein